MIKELKFLLYLFVIFLFTFLITKYYFSDDNKKNSYRSLKGNYEKVFNFSEKLILLENNTLNIVEYIETLDEKKKKIITFGNC